MGLQSEQAHLIPIEQIDIVPASGLLITIHLNNDERSKFEIITSRVHFLLRAR